MDIIILDTFIKSLGSSISLFYIFYKILNHKKYSKTKIICIIFISLFIALIETKLKFIFPNIILTIISYFVFSIILGFINNNKWEHLLTTTIICICISNITLFFSSSILVAMCVIFKITHYSNPIILTVIMIIRFFLIYFFFKIKRFKNGFQFLKDTTNDYLDMFIFIISIIILFIIFLIGNHENFSLNYIFAGLVLFIFALIPILQKTFTLYQKQKLLNKTLKEYETELTETKTKLETALQEKHNLVKSNHEFYHRQEALKQKLNILLQTPQSTYTSETAEEYAQILDRINNLSEEYTNKTKSVLSLPKTNIPELDDMFIYLQSECEKYEIEFILKLNADINHMIETKIPKNKLETLIGDLVRNAIIAINHSNSEYKSIMIIIGVKDNCFEFCVHDSGVEFKIPTLLKLGTEPATTHAEDGGTGIGFITTFETLAYCKASLIINENKPQSNNYTKSVVIRFDNSNRYIVNSYRADDICDFKNSRKDIIINKID